MESTPVTLDTYRTVFLHNDSSLFAISRMIRDFTFRLRLQSVSTMCFIITTLLYILAFPTIGSAMTGYSATVGPYVPDKDGNYIPLAQWPRTAYIIHDGSRINKSDDFHVPHVDYGTRPFLCLYKSLLNTIQTKHFFVPITTPAITSVNDLHMIHTTILNLWLTATCYPTCHRVSKYMIYCSCSLVKLTRISDTWKHGFNGAAQESSNFSAFNLDSPALNITPVYFGTRKDLGLDKNATLLGAAPFDPAQQTWVMSNQSYNLSYFQANGRCQAEKVIQLYHLNIKNWPTD